MDEEGIGDPMGDAVDGLLNEQSRKKKRLGLLRLLDKRFSTLQ